MHTLLRFVLGTALVLPAACAGTVTVMRPAPPLPPDLQCPLPPDLRCPPPVIVRACPPPPPPLYCRRVWNGRFWVRAW